MYRSKIEELKEEFYYKIFDMQLGDFKEDYPLFYSEEEAFEYYSDSLREQLSDGFDDDMTEEEQEEFFLNTTDDEIFEIFQYRVLCLTFDELEDFEQDKVRENKYKKVETLYGINNFKDFENKYDSIIFYADGTNKMLEEELKGYEDKTVLYLFDGWFIALFKTGLERMYNGK